MKSFFKENFVLITGISLPVLLIIIFMIAQGVTRMVDPPHYAAVFATVPHYGTQGAFTFKVEGRKIAATFTMPESPHSAYNPKATLFIFNPLTNNTKKFEFTKPQDVENGQTVPVSLPQSVTSIEIDTSSEAGDGYELTRLRSSSGSIFTDMFGYSSRGQRFAITKKGRRIVIPDTRYSYGEETFLGWIKLDGQ